MSFIGVDHKKVFGRTVGIILGDIEGKSRYNGKIDLYYKLVTVRVFRVKIVRFMSIVLIYSGLYIVIHDRDRGSIHSIQKVTNNLL